MRSLLALIPFVLLTGCLEEGPAPVDVWVEFETVSPPENALSTRTHVVAYDASGVALDAVSFDGDNGDVGLTLDRQPAPVRVCARLFATWETEPKPWCDPCSEEEAYTAEICEEIVPTSDAHVTLTLAR